MVNSIKGHVRVKPNSRFKLNYGKKTVSIFLVESHVREDLEKKTYLEEDVRVKIKLRAGSRTVRDACWKVISLCIYVNSPP